MARISTAAKRLGTPTLPYGRLRCFGLTARNRRRAPAGIGRSFVIQRVNQSRGVVKTSRGTVKFRLYAKRRSEHRERFVELVQQKFTMAALSSCRSWFYRSSGLTPTARAKPTPPCATAEAAKS